MIPSSPSDHQDIIAGRLEAFDSERGHGICWCFNADHDRDGEAKRTTLKKGDILLVFNDAARSEPLWAGVVDLDYNANREELGMYGYSAQVLDSIGQVNGIQKNMDQHLWVMMFESQKPALFIRPPAVRQR